MKVAIFYILFLTTLNANWTTDIKEKTISAYNKTLSVFADENLTISQKRQKHFNKIWKDLFEDLKEAANLEEKIVSAPDDAWIATDKQDIQQDIDEKINDIIEYLSQDDLLSYKDEIISLKQDIDKRKEDILTYREKKIGAPIDSRIYTTVEGYDTKIQEAKDEIKVYENDIRIIKKTLALNLANIGVNLNQEQIDILLTRIDGDDFVQMSLSINVLAQITEQLMDLMKESNEELKQAKKYYAMHLVSLELLVSIQQKYLNQLDKVYIPKIENIIQEATVMIETTNKSLNQDQNIQRKAIYKKNINSQKLTLKVGKLYKNQILNQREQINKAQIMATDNLKLSRNTYLTVLLSADLYGLMTENQQIFDTIMKIQIPKIVPFENIQIQNKYKELTNLLQKD